jgi:hypothetical protein
MVECTVPKDIKEVMFCKFARISLLVNKLSTPRASCSVHSNSFPALFLLINSPKISKYFTFLQKKSKFIENIISCPRKYVKVIGRSFLFKLHMEVHLVNVATEAGRPIEFMDFC